MWKSSQKIALRDAKPRAISTACKVELHNPKELTGFNDQPYFVAIFRVMIDRQPQLKLHSYS